MPQKACIVDNIDVFNRFNLLAIENCNDNFNLESNNVNDDVPICTVNDKTSSDVTNVANNCIFKEMHEVKITNPKNIIIAHININSIRNKFSELKVLLQLNLIHVLIISETKLDSSFKDSLFQVEKYKMYRQDNTAKSGGLILYVNENIASSCGDICVQEKHFECLSINVFLDNRKYLIMGAYKNPKLKDNDFEHCFEKLYDNVIKKADVESIFLGDLNLNMLQPSCILHELCDRYNLHQMVKDTTCRKSSKETLIDVILVSNTSLFKTTFAKDINLSDYHLLVGVVMRKFAPPPKVEYRYIRMYSKIDYEQASKEVRSLNLLDKVYLCADANEKFETINSSLAEIMDKLAPRKRVKIKQNRLPVMTGVLRKAILNRNMLRNRYFKSRSKVNFAQYRKARNTVISIKRTELKEHLKSKCQGANRNKNFWATMKPYFSKKMKTRSEIMLCENGEIITDRNKLCSIFNEYFVAIGSDIGNKENQCLTVEEIVANHAKVDTIKQIKHKIDTNKISFNFQPVPQVEVENVINELQCNKATGCDEIPALFIKKLLPELIVPITLVINECMWQGIFPMAMKRANITPLYKKKDSLAKENYRSVSVLTAMSKILERIMYRQMYTYFSTNQIFHPLVSGFRPGHSCNHMLLKLTEDIKKSLDQNMFAGLIAMDLSRAFDVIPHGLLIAKVKAYGFSLHSCEMLLSYLKNRKQRVKIGDMCSVWVTPCKGVPQGSILGPLIFNIFMNDFFDISLKSQIYNYADDNTLCLIGNNITQLRSNLETDATKAVRWFSNNHMQANPEKFQVMLISRKCTDFSLNICGSEIIANEYVEILGVILDNKLKYVRMINELCRRAGAQINVLYRLRNKLDYESKLRIYDSFVISNVSYCQIVWTHCSVASRRKLEKLNERALRFVNNDFDSGYDDQLVKANRCSLLATRVKSMGIEMCKVNNLMSPMYINELFSREFCMYSLRAKNTFYLPKCSTFSHGYRSFSYLGVKLWNAFSNEMRSCTDVKDFKKLINNWIIDRDVTQFI